MQREEPAAWATEGVTCPAAHGEAAWERRERLATLGAGLPLQRRLEGLIFRVHVEDLVASPLQVPLAQLVQVPAGGSGRRWGAQRRWRRCGWRRCGWPILGADHPHEAVHGAASRTYRCATSAPSSPPAATRSPGHAPRNGLHVTGCRLIRPRRCLRLALYQGVALVAAGAVLLAILVRRPLERPDLLPPGRSDETGL